MRIIFLLTNSSMPNLPSSRPKPERLMPPKWQLRSLGADAVDEDHAGFDAICPTRAA